MRALLLLIILICGCVGCERRDPMKIMIVARDPQLQVASAAAQSAITNFLAALRSPAANQSNFVICVEFASSGGVPEPLWIGYLEHSEGRFKGRVVTQPKLASSLTNGQPVLVPMSDVADWAYMEGEKLVGGFTMRVVRSKMSDAERQSYDAQLPYRIE